MSHHTSMHRVAALALLAAGTLLPSLSQAESNFQSGTGALTATAKLDFKITVPKVLFLQIGTGTNLAANTAVDLVDFTVPAANVGNGTSVAATTNGTVNAKVLGNGGNITLTSASLGALNNGVTAETISFAQIATTAATLSTGTVLAAPTIVDGGVSPAVTLTATNKVVNQDAKWTFSYLNTAVPSAGTYGGAGVNNGRVTYTAAMP